MLGGSDSNSDDASRPASSRTAPPANFSARKTTIELLDDSDSDSDSDSDDVSQTASSRAYTPPANLEFLYHRGESQDEDAPQKAPIAGFRNYGQTCFINVLLQCLRHISPPLLRMIQVTTLKTPLEMASDMNEVPASICDIDYNALKLASAAHEFQHLMKQTMRHPKRTLIEPGDFIRKAGFSYSNPHDAQEVWSTLFVPLLKCFNAIDFFRIVIRPCRREDHSSPIIEDRPNDYYSLDVFLPAKDGNVQR